MVRRRGLWIPQNASFAASSASSDSVDLLANMPEDLLQHGGLTVSRIIGEVAFVCDVIGTRQLFTAGIMVSDQGSTDSQLGIDLTTGPAENVMWYLATVTHGAFMEVAAGDFDGIMQYRSFDVRVQRKMKISDHLDFVIKNDSGQTVSGSVGARAYIKLP